MSTKPKRLGLGPGLAAARKAAGLSQEAVARRLNVSLATWSRWERGINRPPDAMLERIAGVLGVEFRPAEIVPPGGGKINFPNSAQPAPDSA